MKKNWKHYMAVCVTAVLCVSPLTANAAVNKIESYPVSQGVQYEKYTYTSSTPNNINHLKIDLNEPNTKVKIGMTPEQNGRAATTSIANSHSYDGHRVVGAVNAGFFNMSEGYPSYLIAENNKIINGGRIVYSNDEFVSQPIAFGVKKDGKATIDYYDFDITMTHNGQSYALDAMNRTRFSDEAIVYTPQFYGNTTLQNSEGVEIVVDTGTEITKNEFGQKLTGTVKNIFPVEEKWPAAIPKTGFVISLHGGWTSKLAHIKVGDEISLNFDIDSKWKDAQFMLATGPLLVQDGKANIKIDPNSQRARTVTARTVVGVDKDTNKVHFITVDGKQTNSQGMNLIQLANFLVDMGIDSAINLDGGGSTTMGIRKYGSNMVYLANKPADGSQRRVSSILEAVSLAKFGTPKTAAITRSRNGTFLAGAGATVSVNYVLDEFYNTLPLSASNLSLASEKGTLSTSGLSYKTTTAGDDRIFVKYDGKQVQSFPVKVVNGPSKLTLKASNTNVDTNGTSQFSITALDAAGQPLLYDASQVKYSVEGNIGTIDAKGKFTASANPGKGKVIVQLGTTKSEVAMTVTQPKRSPYTDIPDNYTYIDAIMYLSDKGYFKGYDDGTFRPTQTLSREHAVVVINRILNLDTNNVKNPGFSDVPVTHRYYKEIAAAANAQIIGGENGKFNPSGQLTRAHMSKILTNAFKLSGSSNKNFTDVTAAHWAYPYIQTLVANNITTGYEDGSFRPGIPITRAHFALFLYRTLQ